MTFEAILKDLKQKKYAPIYFLQGEESYFIDEISHYIAENVLPETDKSFDQTVVYGKDIDALTLVSYAKRYPMMAPYQVLIVKEAQNMAKIDDLLSYFEHPLHTTILVMCYKYGKLDKRSKLSKTIEKQAIVFTSDKLYDNKIPTWIIDHVTDKGLTINSISAQLIADYLGNDLSKISNELNKMMLNLHGRKDITQSDIEANIGISKEYNIFELQNAIGERNVLKANMIINYFAANEKVKSPMFISSIFGFFSKLMIYHALPDKSKSSVASALGVNPFFVDSYVKAANLYPLPKIVEIIGHLRKYDMKSKGWDGGDLKDGGLLKELLFKILH